MILKNNPNAPVEPSYKYLQSFKYCYNIFNLHKDIKKEKAVKNYKKLRMLYCKLKCLIKNLLKQAIVNIKIKYFEHINQLYIFG